MRSIYIDQLKFLPDQFDPNVTFFRSSDQWYRIVCCIVIFLLNITSSHFTDHCFFVLGERYSRPKQIFWLYGLLLRALLVLYRSSMQNHLISRTCIIIPVSLSFSVLLFGSSPSLSLLSSLSAHILSLKRSAPSSSLYGTAELTRLSSNRSELALSRFFRSSTLSLVCSQILRGEKRGRERGRGVSV
jgi:hypothetical protein